MVKGSKKPGLSYKIWIEPEVYKAKDILPGKIRQRPPYDYQDLPQIVANLIK